MRPILLLPIALLASVGATAQKLPPANPVPLEQSDTSAVLAPINAIFAAIAIGDAAALLTHVYPDGRVTATGLRASGVSGIRSESWSAFAKRITPEAAFEERITDPAIEIDDDVAMVWARFVVRRQGKLVNCGFDHFDLIRENGVWKVMNLSFSSRTTDCAKLT
ncbi:MAG: nuclear transport factor 2 family protein [Sphingomonas sp.]